ncbi:MAG: prepilin-type N-terminal cleavage/methylation domain-containing protein [Deltaproteobacteria bacterium]|nr:prepilin-type N-terminal cleavage/methylation domain-containing protein [Deltaproteobacteria bacterium]
MGCAGIGKKGFTMVEILVVIAIISVMSAIAIPSLVSAVYHIRLTRATRDVAVGLQAARMKAISRNVAFQVKFTQGTLSSYILQRWNATMGAWVNDASEYGGGKTIEAGVKITSPGGNFSAVFFPAGTVQGNNGTLLTGGTTADQKICLTNERSSTADQLNVSISAASGKVEVNNGC